MPHIAQARMQLHRLQRAPVIPIEELRHRLQRIVIAQIRIAVAVIVDPP